MPPHLFYPSAPRFGNYPEYLRSPQWQLLRTLKLNKYDRCEVCRGLEHLQVHHVLYRSNWVRSRLKDLMTLCPRCHQLIHRELAAKHLKIQPHQSPTEIKRITVRYLRMSLDENYWQWWRKKRLSPNRIKILKAEFIDNFPSPHS